MRKSRIAALAGLMLAVGSMSATGVTAAQASARPAIVAGATVKPQNAIGCSVGGTITSYCEAVVGSGDFVYSVEGSFASTSPICNWSITGEFFNASSQWYRTYVSPTHYSCSYVNHDYVYPDSTMQTGFVCSTLRQNGSAVISRCEAIHP
jgi:hypothetical protein